MTPYYEDSLVTIWHGDCREILPTVEAADLVLTDPPYGVGWDKRKSWGSSNKGKAKDYGKQLWDARPLDCELATAICAASANQIIWGANHFASVLPNSPCWLVWDKDNTGDFADCELAWTSFPRAVRKFKWRWNGMIQQDMANKEARQHPTQKPLALMKWCLSLEPDAQTILDPFMGSGTTLRAAKDLGRRAIGIEIEERYCEIAAKRMSQEVLFTGERGAA